MTNTNGLQPIRTLWFLLMFLQDMYPSYDSNNSWRASRLDWR